MKKYLVKVFVDDILTHQVITDSLSEACLVSDFVDGVVKITTFESEEIK